MRKTILTLLLILLISGCTGSDVFQGLIPGMEQQQVKELPPDIVTIESLTVIPNPPINANDQFSVNFLIKNQDDINTVNDVEYSLFDDGLCERSSSSASPETGTYELVPLQEEFIDWTFDAPENSQIASLSTTCPIRFSVEYSFLSRSQIDTQVIEEERLKEIQRSGQTATFTPTLTLGRGPIKIYLSFGASLPIRASKEGSPRNQLPLYILVEDKGQGLYGNIAAGSLVLRIPEEFEILDCDKFTLATSTDLEGLGIQVTSGYRHYKNKGDPKNNKDSIPLIRKKTAQLRCSIGTPLENDITLEKTFYITAFLKYSYTITGETIVAIEPTA